MKTFEILCKIFKTSFMEHFMLSEMFMNTKYNFTELLYQKILINTGTKLKLICFLGLFIRYFESRILTSHPVCHVLY